jgi:hypothetical protein
LLWLHRRPGIELRRRVGVGGGTLRLIVPPVRSVAVKQKRRLGRGAMSPCQD